MNSRTSLVLGLLSLLVVVIIIYQYDPSIMKRFGEGFEDNEDDDNDENDPDDGTEGWRNRHIARKQRRRARRQRRLNEGFEDIEDNNDNTEDDDIEGWSNMHKQAKKDARHERKEDKRDARHERKEDRRDARHERKEDRRDARHERKEDKRDARRNSNRETFVDSAPADFSASLPPAGCYPRDQLTPSELLPADQNSIWAQQNPMGSGSLKGKNFLSAGALIGVNTVGQTLRNANQQIRSEPPNPQSAVSIFNQSTIAPDMNRRPLEIGA